MHRRPRRLTAFVTLLWLNLAMLPCTMAAADADHGVPSDCPSSASTVQHGHGSDHAHDAELQHHRSVGEHADHGSDGEGHPCMSGADCCVLDDVLLSDSAKKLDRDSSSLPPVAYDVACFDELTGSHRGHSATGPPTLFAGAVRLHALHCVYRD